MPAVPDPADCPPFDYDWVRREDDVNAHFDKRGAKGRFGKARIDAAPSEDGITRLWIRPHSGIVDRTTLAVMADFLPSGVGNALGTAAGGNSLDYTIRFARLVPTVWVLADIRIHATASQSMILRIR